MQKNTVQLLDGKAMQWLKKGKTNRCSSDLSVPVPVRCVCEREREEGEREGFH